jgi:hypothetical protein
MIDAALTQFLIDVTRGPKTKAFAENREAVVDASGLPKELCRAVKERDIASLWRAGAHPMALLYFSRNCGWSGDRYYECIAAATTPPEIRDGR